MSAGLNQSECAPVVDDRALEPRGFSHPVVVIFPDFHRLFKADCDYFHLESNRFDCSIFAISDRHIVLDARENFTSSRIRFLYGPPIPITDLTSFFPMPYALEYSNSPLISWDRALYFTICGSKELLCLLIFSIRMVLRVCLGYCVYGIFCSILGPFILLYDSVSRSFSFAFCNAGGILQIFVFSYSVRCIFGISTIPFCLVSCYILYRDYFSFKRMASYSPSERTLIKNRYRVLLALRDYSVPQFTRVCRAYKMLADLGASKILNRKVKYFYFPNYSIDGEKFYNQEKFCSVLESDMTKLLEMEKSFVPTSSGDNVWNFVHPFLSACGSGINAKHSLMIQDCLLFIGKVIYAMTDTRTARFGALAADLISFRNTACGQAMSEAGFEYFGKLANEFVAEIEPPKTFRMSDFHSQRIRDQALAGGHLYSEFAPTSFGFADLSKMLGGLEQGLRTQAVKRVLQLVAIVVAIVSFCGQGTFNLEGITRVTKAIKAQPFDEAVDSASQLVSLLKWLGEAGWHLFAFSGSAAASVDAAANWRKSAEEILSVKNHANYANILGTGIVDIEGNKLPLSVFQARIATLIKLDWKLVESTLRVTSSKYVTAEFKSLHQKLVAFESEIQAQLMTQVYRKAPFGLALVGGTAIGKSTITNLVFAYYSFLRGVEHLPEMVFSHPSFTEFWDTFFGQDYILFDDVGAVHPQSKAMDNSLFDILQVANNAPYIVPMAQADAKGTRCVTAKMIVATSNQLDLGVRNLFATPTAILRRFNLFARMTVKPAFACPLGRLDPIKIAAFWAQDRIRKAAFPQQKKPYSERFPPFWDFHILELDQNGLTGKSVRIFDEDESATMDFLKFLFENVQAHEKNQDRVMDSFSSLRSMTKCKKCFSPVDVCTCPGDPDTDRSRYEDFSATVGEAISPFFDEVEPEDNRFFFSCVLFVNLLVIFFLCWYLANPVTFLLQFLFELASVCSLIIVTVQFSKGFFLNKVHLEPVTSSAKLPLVMLLSMFSNCNQSVSDLWSFMSIVAKGGFTRQSWFEACMDRLKKKVGRFFTTRNMLVVSMTACVVSLVAGPLFQVFFSQRWFTCSGLTESPPLQPAEVEDSRSTYYNPNPPQRTTSDRSRCLSGGSSSPWIENSLRKCTCTIRFYDEANVIMGELIGLAIGGTLVMTMAHAVIETTSPLMGSGKVRATHGIISFPSLAGLGNSTHKFNLIPGSYVVDLENDFFLFDVPSMPSRSSLVEYFLETNDALDGIYTCRMVKPSTWNFVSNMVKTDPDFGRGFAKGFLTTAFVLNSPIPWGTGNSGSCLVAQSAAGTVLLGQQSLADKNNTIMTNFIGRSYLKIMIRKITGTAAGQFSFIPKSAVVGLNSTFETLLGAPSRTCPLLHEPESCQQENYSFVGALQSTCGKGATRVGEPPYRGFFLTRGYVTSKIAPTFDYKSKRHYLQQISKISHDIDSRCVNAARDTLLEHWIERYTAVDELKLLVPLSLEEAINGSDTVTWVETLKFSTSAGFPWNKPKLQLLEQRPSVAYRRGYEYYLPPGLRSEFDLYVRSLADAEPLNYPYKGTQKDEPISADKNESRGPRIFCAANLFVIMAGRMLFGSYIRLAQRNIFISWAAVGVNAASKVWGLLWLWISSFGTHRIMAGDYSNFDQNMSPLFTRAAFAIIIGLMEASGNFEPELLVAARAWSSETINPTVILDNDVFSIAGTNPSGNPLTVHINCIVNILFILYVWIAIGNNAREFFIKVKMMTYGDDNLISVCDEVGNFHYWIIHTKLKEIGVMYTPADKSIPTDKQFDLLRDITFLKRGFLLRGGFYFAPLELASFAKTFLCWMVSPQDERSHGLDTLCSCWENAAHLDPETRDKVHRDILDACESLDWPTGQFKSISELELRFREAEVNRWDELVDQSGLKREMLSALGLSPCLERMLEGGLKLGMEADCFLNWAVMIPILEEFGKLFVGFLIAFWHNIFFGGPHPPPHLGPILPMPQKQYVVMFTLVASAIFAFIELCEKYTAFGTINLRMIPVFILHICIGSWPLCGRIATHVAFNSLTMLFYLNYSFYDCKPTLGCMDCVYKLRWSEMFSEHGRNFMYHGLAFSQNSGTRVFSRWFSIQDSSWVRVLRELEPDQSAGPGIMPVLDNRFVDEEEPEDVGTFDGFYLIDGPEFEDPVGVDELPQGPE